MSKKPEKRGLGRGLSALMADVNLNEPKATSEPTSADTSAPRRPDLQVPIEKIVPNPDQPRRQFSEEALQELAASIREKGVIQPLIVRANPRKEGSYEIVAGERRWRASQIAQLHKLPVIVREFTDAEVLEVAIIENIQRADLNPVEEAQGYKQLMERFGHTQEKLAEALSKSRSHIANLMRLLTLPEPVLGFLREGQLSAGHARALITTENPLELAKEVIAKGLSVRETEKLAKGPKASAPRSSSGGGGKSAEKDADTRALEKDLSAALRMAVTIDHTAGQEDGVLTIKYKTLDELDDLCRILSRG